MTTQRQSGQSPVALDGLLACVDAEAQAHAGKWFPELTGDRIRTRVESTEARARCFLVKVVLDDGAEERTVLVKVRHSLPHLRRRDKFAGRPQLTPERITSDEHAAQQEVASLQAIADVFTGLDPTRFDVLRPLAHIPEHAAIVMPLVKDPTLRTRLLATSRTHRHRSPALEDTAWVNAGGWLRLFHDRSERLGPTPRLGDPDELYLMYQAICRFLHARGEDRSLLSRVESTARDLVGTLSNPAELTPGHGDFVANNMFATSSGTVTVFDALSRWLVPRYQDLSTLTLGLRVLPVQAITHGFALPENELARYEAAVMRGYFGSEAVPWRQVHAYQLLVLLDRWSDLLSKRPPTGVLRPHLRQVKVKVAGLHYRREAERLLEVIDPQHITRTI